MRATTRMLLISLCAWCGAGAGVAAGAARRRDYAPYMFAAVPLHAPVPVLHVLSPAPLSVAPPAGRLAPRAARPYRPYASPVQHSPYTRPLAPPRPYAERGPYAESRPYSDVRPYVEPGPYTEPYSYAETRPYPDSVYDEPRPYGSSRPYAEPRPYAPAPARPAETLSHSDVRLYGAGRPYVEAVEYYEAAAPRPPAATELQPEWEAPAAPEELAGSQEAAVLYARPSPSGGYSYRPLAGKKPPKKVPSSKERPVVIKIHKHRIVKS